jgi:hypothetical protein
MRGSERKGDESVISEMNKETEREREKERKKKRKKRKESPQNKQFF